MSEMCASKNKLARLEPHWNFILPHINMCLSPERRPLKLYLFLIWWTKLDYKNKHTWSICIIPVAEIHLHWIMTMTKTNKWGLPPYSGPLLGICCVGNLHPSPFTPTLNTNCFFSLPRYSLQWLRSKISICYIGINCRVMDYDRCVAEKEGKEGWAQSNDNHKVLSCGRLGYE